ncbi:MAG: glycosyltransferase [Nocardioidaceae bacterium]
MIRVLHVPSHLAYVAMLSDDSFGPVSPPTRYPLTVAQLVRLQSWAFFDVLHLHSIELATAGDLELLFRLARGRNVRVVVTVHDVVPTIEADGPDYRHKLAVVVQRADAVLTLTRAAAAELAGLVGPEPAAHVVSHGAALPLELALRASRTEDSRALAVYGALRPNRDVMTVVDAWRCLAAPRPPLRMLLRSVGPPDERRYAETLTALREVAAVEPAMDLEIMPDFVPAQRLVRWLALAGALVLPYLRVTHSGQLELACDLGLPVLAPKVPTLRAQLVHNGARHHPVVWYPASELRSSTRFAERLAEVGRLYAVGERRRQAFLAHRRSERSELLGLHRSLYAGHAP